MSTWSKSSLKLPSVVVTDKSFPALGGGTPTGPPSKKPVLMFAQKVKETAEAQAAADAAAAAKARAESERLAAQRLAETAERRRVSLIGTFYNSHRTSDEDYAHADSSPDEMDYEAAVEYEEHLRFNRRERARVTDYSKDLSSEEDEREYETHDDRAI